MNMKFSLGIWLSLSTLTFAAGLEFSEESKEMKAPTDATTVTADFNFTNKSDKPVTIDRAEPGCSCLKVQISGGKLKYAPGESGVIRATFEMGNFSGVVDKNVALYLEKDPEGKPTKNLLVRVEIPVLIQMEPKTLDWSVGDKSEPKTIQFKITDEKPIKVLSVKGGNPAFSYELKTLEEGRRYDLVVTPLTTEKPGMSVIRIETDSPIPRYHTQQAFAVVRKPAAGQTASKP